MIAFLLVLVGGLGYALYSLVTDMNAVGQSPLAIGAFALPGLALLIALAFEFVNGFRDTANAVATGQTVTPSNAAQGVGARIALGHDRGFLARAEPCRSGLGRLTPT